MRGDRERGFRSIGERRVGPDCLELFNEADRGLDRCIIDGGELGARQLAHQARALFLALRQEPWHTIDPAAGGVAEKRGLGTKPVAVVIGMGEVALEDRRTRCRRDFEDLIVGPARELCDAGDSTQARLIHKHLSHGLRWTVFRLRHRRHSARCPPTG